jgi:hypothetical protein
MHKNCSIATTALVEFPFFHLKCVAKAKLVFILAALFAKQVSAARRSPLAAMKKCSFGRAIKPQAGLLCIF